MNINQLNTPCLLIDQQKMRHNIARLSRHIEGLACKIRPHVKTHKSIEITQEIIAGGNVSGITVSTIKEAQHFFANGFSDILYAVGIVPNKFAQVRALREQGCDIKVILDSLEAAILLIDYAQRNSCSFSVLIELDVDNHRAGVNPSSDDLIEIAKALAYAPDIHFVGVMTHAGGSYQCATLDAQKALAIQERDLSVFAAERIRKHKIPCPVVSIGSTPTAFAIDDLSGITEVRAGVYVLFDLVMAGLGVCNENDIAISVLGSVIGFQKQKQHVLIDAGWMAMSRDRGTNGQAVDQGYGVICNHKGEIQSGLILHSANQEHGIIGTRSQTLSSEQELKQLNQFNIGDLLRVLPNHACATAAQYETYYLVSGTEVLAQLHSVNGW